MRIRLIRVIRVQQKASCEDLLRFPATQRASKRCSRCVRFKLSGGISDDSWLWIEERSDMMQRQWQRHRNNSRRKGIQFLPENSGLNLSSAVQVHRFDGRATDGRAANDSGLRSVPLKVFCPLVSPWIEKARSLFADGIDCHLLLVFMAVT